MTENSKKMIPLSIIEFLLVVIVSAFIGYSLNVISYKINKSDSSDNNYSNCETKDNCLSEKNIITDTYNYILKEYYKEIDPNDLVNGAVKGMLDSIKDPYTTYMENETYDTFNITLNGSYEGLGVEVSKQDDYIVIVGIFADSPAKEAGLLLGDKIISVDDKTSKDMSASDFSQYVRTSSKKTFEFIIERDGKQKKYTLTRRQIELKSTTSKIFEEKGKKIGYIFLSIFATNSFSQFKNELNNLEKENINSLIIDLRDNSGGDLASTTNIIGLFVDGSKIIYQTEDRHGNIEKTLSNGKNDKKYPIVLLVNGNSASASEVMTAALKENINAYVIGENTYGKGTVQTLGYLPNGSQYKMTIKKWLTPKGNWINDVGIAPDMEIKNTGNSDNQLDAAINYLKER